MARVSRLREWPMQWITPTEMPAYNIDIDKHMTRFPPLDFLCFWQAPGTRPPCASDGKVKWCFFTFTYICNVSINLHTFEKAQFAKYRSTAKHGSLQLKNALFRA